MPADDPSGTLDTNVTDLRAARFEAAWLGRKAGQPPPRWQDYLPTADEPGSANLIFLLLQMDIECRIKAGLSALLIERYFEHPRLQQPDGRLDAERQRELIRWEYQQRWRAGQRAQRSEYQAAFPEHADALSDLKPRSNCPRCRKMIVLDETALTLLCPACESLAAQSTLPPDGESSGRLVPGLDPRSYELLERLGGGGMGDVYRAGDPALGRDLAVKVIAAGLQGHSEAERRFLREARVTGSLQHPGVVPIHNLGRLADGRLHYTMRLVRGRTLSDILKEQAGQPERLPELLTIFEKVCQAVAYAHSRRVIHRDLKPANVMVGRFGEVQVMDWGLAKLLSPGDEPTDVEVPGDGIGTRIHTEASDTPSEWTRMGSEMGTPAYMPPEQALGEWDAVDERADVFALGAILCEILIGRPPYSGRDGMEVLRKAKRGDLADASGRLDGCGADAALVTLCRECLAPEREGRPHDAEAVARRVAAYQTEVQERLRRAELGRAEAQVKAQEERKRRRWAIAAVLFLLAGVAVSTWQAVRATVAEGRTRTERDEKDSALEKAEAAAEAARQANEVAQNRLRQIKKGQEVLASIFHDLNPRAEEKGGPSLPEQLLGSLKKAAAQLDGLAVDDPLTVADLQNTLGESFLSLGDAPQAIALLTKARSIRETKLGPDHPDTLTNLNSLARAYQEAGQLDKALPLYEQTLAKRKDKLGPDHPDTLSSMDNLAKGYHEAGLREKALPLFEQTLEKQKIVLGPDHPDTLVSMNNLAEVYGQTRQFDKALSLHEQTFALKLNKLGLDHPQTLGSMNNLASQYYSLGRLDKALPLFEQTLTLMTVKRGADHPDTLTCMSNLAVAHQLAGHLDRALPLLEQTLSKRKIKRGPNHPETLISMNNLAMAYKEIGRLDEALPLLEQTLAKFKSKLGLDHPDTLKCMNNLASAYQAAGKLDRGTPILHELLEWRREKADLDSLATIGTLAPLGENLLKYNEFAEAESVLRDCLALRVRKVPDDWRTFNSRSVLGDALLGQKKYSEAEPLLLQGYEGMKRREDKIPLPGKARLTEALERLVRLYDATNQKEKAAEWRIKLDEAKTRRKKSKP